MKREPFWNPPLWFWLSIPIGLIAWITLFFILTGCDLDRYYMRKCLNLCNDRGGEMIDFVRIQDDPKKWECSCKVETKIEKVEFNDV